MLLAKNREKHSSSLFQIPSPNPAIRPCMSHHGVLLLESFSFSYAALLGVEYWRRSKKVAKAIHGRLSFFHATSVIKHRANTNS
jgi:hypothetical protein